MGNVGLGGPRPGPMSSFAQTIGSSSQPSTPLDLSYVIFFYNQRIFVGDLIYGSQFLNFYTMLQVT